MGLLLLGSDRLARKHGHAAGHVTAQGAEAGRVFHGASGLLEAEAETFFAVFATTLLQFGGRQWADGRGGGGLVFLVLGHR